MPITIRKDSLFKAGYSLKYITGWDNNFKRDKYTGLLSFYNSSPKYIVDIEILSNEGKLKEEDIIVTIGDSHNPLDTEEKISDNKDVIYEACKNSISNEFLFDLETLKVVEPKDFTGNFPTYGLNTLFMFENVPGKIFCLVNPAKNVSDSDFFAWFVSYIYSCYICLTPNSKIEDYPKKFLQAISSLACSQGKSINISNKATVLNCELNDVGELLLPIPGNNTKRFEHLVEAALEQKFNKSKKGKKK